MPHKEKGSLYPEDTKNLRKTSVLRTGHIKLCYQANSDNSSDQGRVNGQNWQSRLTANGKKLVILVQFGTNHGHGKRKTKPASHGQQNSAVQIFHLIPLQ